MKVAPTELRKKLFITIRGEEALDYGGVAKLVLMLYCKNINYCEYSISELPDYKDCL